MDTATLLSRPRLMEALAETRFGIVEAPGGHGKSTLLHLLAEAHGGVTISCSLAAQQGPAILRSALATAARRIGLAAAADVIGSPATTVEEIARVVEQRGGGVRFVVDEVQFADDDAAEWLVSLAEALPFSASLVVAGRRTPRPMEAAVRSGAALRLTATELCFDRAEVSALLARADRAAVGGEDAGLVDDVLAATNGWPAAVTIAISAISAGPPPESWASAEVPRTLPGDGALLRSLVHHLTRQLDHRDRRRLAALAELPVIDEEAATIVAGPRAMDIVRDAGIPLVARPDGWWTLADPVRDVLRSGGVEIGAEIRREIAEHFARRGHLALGLTFLQRVGDHRGVAQLLGRRHWHELRELGLVSLDLTLAALPDDVLVEELSLLLAAARVGELTDPPRRGRWLDRAAALAPVRGDAAMERAIVVEQARDAVRRGDFDVATRINDVLTSVTVSESATVARALTCLAHVDTVRATPSDLRRAEERLEEAIARFRALGDVDWEADALLRLGYAVSYQGGRLERAIDQLGRCLALLPAPGRDRGMVLSHFAEVLGAVGRADEAEAMAREGVSIGRRLGDSWVIAACAWTAMIVAAHRGDLAGVRSWMAQAEASPGAWLEVGAGAEYLIEAADVLAALGAEDDARAYHERARVRTELLGVQDALLPVTARIDSTFGDPARVEGLLASFEGGPFAVERTKWVRRLLRAQAALRLGDRTAAQSHVDAAIGELDALGDRDTLWRTERGLAERLSELLPSRLRRPETTWQVTLLGVWRVERDGRECTPPHGRPSQLVKWLALRGPAVADEAIDMLWPDIDPALGRSRLRNLLNRLRDRTGDLVVREGESLSLAAGTSVDSVQFDRLARAALSAPQQERAGMARRALATYTGELLVGDVFEAWTTPARERLRRLRVALLDLVVAETLGRGDLDEALALLDEAITLEPLDDRRYVLAAEALLQQGRRGSAAELIGAGVRQLEEVGLHPGERLLALWQVARTTGPGRAVEPAEP